MDKGECIICLDVGSHSLKAVAGIWNNEKLEVVASNAVPSRGIVRGVVSNMEEFTLAVEEVLDHLNLTEYGSLVLSVSNYHIDNLKTKQAKYLSGGKQEITKEDVEDLLFKAKSVYMENDKQVLEVLAQDYKVDDTVGVENPVGMVGSHLEGTFNVITCKANTLFNIEKCVKEAGYEVDKFVFSPYYAASVLLKKEEKEAGVLMVEMGGGVTTTLMYKSGRLTDFFAIPFGGSNITQDIKEGCAVLPKVAESLKVQFAQAEVEKTSENNIVSIPPTADWGAKEVSFKTLSIITQCRLDELFEGILYQLKKTNQLQDVKSGIILTGGAAKLRGLVSYLTQKFDLEAKIRKPAVNLVSKLAEKQYVGPEYAGILGVLQQELQKQQLPKTKKDKKSSKGALKRFLGALFDNEDAEM